jgi:leishmanolysin-like peptidase
MHISDWYTTFSFLGKSQHPGDSGPGRFDVDGRNLWPYLFGTESSVPPHANGILVIGFNYSTMLYPVTGGYDNGSGAIIEVVTGYKLIVGSQNLCEDCLQWDPRAYPCNRTTNGVDCIPHCLFNVLEDESERHELSANATGKDAEALSRLLQAYETIGKEPANELDKQWNEQGTPWDPEACATAHREGGYWRPWLPPLQAGAG